MSVIPLTVDGERPTVVNTQEAFEAGQGVNGPAILIMNLAREQLQRTDIANVTYDLRVGALYRDHRAPAPANLPEGKAINIQPGEAVIIQTEEWVHVPRAMFGHVVPKVSLLQEGLSNTSSKVDPGYDGHLLVTVFNLGQRIVTLARGAPFCALYILQVTDSPQLYTKPGKGLEGQRVHITRWARFADWLQRYDAIVKTVIGVLTLGLTALTAVRAFGQ